MSFLLLESLDFGYAIFNGMGPKRSKAIQINGGGILTEMPVVDEKTPDDFFDE